MHEMALATSVLQIVEDTARRHGAVARERGAPRDRPPVARGVRGAALLLRRRHAQQPRRRRAARDRGHRGMAWCMRCSDSIALERLGDPCPCCGSYQLQVTGGDECGSRTSRFNRRHPCARPAAADRAKRGSRARLTSMTIAPPTLRRTVRRTSTTSSTASITSWKQRALPPTRRRQHPFAPARPRSRPSSRTRQRFALRSWPCSNARSRHVTGAHRANRAGHPRQERRVRRAESPALARARDVALNLVSSPARQDYAARQPVVAERRRICVIEGDQQTRLDADRIAATGAPVVQINTGKGCHLDAHQGRARPRQPAAVALVPGACCSSRTSATSSARPRSTSAKPAQGGDAVGDGRRGQAAQVPGHVPRRAAPADHQVRTCCRTSRSSVAAACSHARAVQPDLDILTVSSLTGAGMAEWLAWLFDGAMPARHENRPRVGARWRPLSFTWQH